MAREADAALQAKILQVGFVVFLGLAALYSVRSLMFGSRSVAGLVGAFCVILTAVLVLDKEYWILFPLISASGLSIPTLPFVSTELGCLVLVAVFFVRAVLRRDTLHFHSTHYLLWGAPYFLWCAIVFCMNPVGLHMFGSSMIGGRHYFRLAVGLATWFCLAQIELSEKGLKMLFFGLIVCSFIQVFLGYFGFIVETEVGVEAHTRYYLTAFGTLLSLLLCRFDLSKIVLSPGLFLSCLACACLVLVSGKRTTVGTLLLTPFVLMFLRRREYGFTIGCGIVAAIALGILASGQGRLYELPYSAQRGLSFLPGKWDRTLERYGFNDDFREELHRRAKNIIHEHPWVGRKGYAMDPREISWVILNTQARDTMFAGHELASNWHNKFYGMWADFGAVAPFSWYGFMIAVWLWTYRKRNEHLDNSYASTFYRYWACLIFFDLILAYGHSSLTPFGFWPRFGLLIALENTQMHRRFEPSSQGSAVSGLLTGMT